MGEQGSKNGKDSNFVLTQCYLCNDKFDLKSSRQDFLNHSLEEHGLIIKDSDCIINLSGYVNEWREIFKSSSLKDICSSNKSTSQFELSDAIELDKQLREKLNKKSLESALDQQKLERDDVKFSRKCLFCRHVIEPTRSAYLNHLSTNHNIQLGKPDNLVNIDQYLDLIQQTIDDLKCIFCEKSFKDRNVLKEHMRKKLHKRVNPNNSIYDQFYMVNYLAPGLANKRFRERKRRMSPNEEDDDGDWSDWKEENKEPISCLFCLDTCLSWESVLDHLIQKHNFDFKTLSSQLDFYQKVKLVNYIRHCIYKSQCINCDNQYDDRSKLLEHLTQQNHFHLPLKNKYDQPEYFFPTNENDGFLYHLDDSPEPSLGSDDEINNDEMKPGFLQGLNENVKLFCFFCPFENSEGDVVLDHMYDIHHFDYHLYTHSYSFMDRVKLISYTLEGLSNKKCILTDCKETFNDIESLAEHMKVNKHYDSPHQNLWIQTPYQPPTSKVNNSKEDKVNIVDYLFALENVNSVVKEVDKEEINKEVVDAGCFSDADVDEESDYIPLLCLFCSHESNDFNKALAHLDSQHNFPYVKLTKNMSFYDQVKMITYIRKNVSKLVCPVCVKNFEDKQTLCKHIDTDKHCVIPPSDLWDKSIYYPASFTGDAFLSELNVLHATDTLTTQKVESSATSNQKTSLSQEKKGENSQDFGGSADSDWGDWDEEMKILVECLLCKHVSDSWLDIHPHMKQEHNFSYLSISSGLIFYDQVKLVNYIRHEIGRMCCFVCQEKFSSNEELLQHCKSNNHLNLPDKKLWDKDEYMKPYLDNDGFLSHIDDGDSDDDI